VKDRDGAATERSWLSWLRKEIRVKGKEIPHEMNTYHDGDASDDDSSAGHCSWCCGSWHRQEGGTEEWGEEEEEGEGEGWWWPGTTWQPHARHLEGELQVLHGGGSSGGQRGRPFDARSRGHRRQELAPPLNGRKLARGGSSGRRPLVSGGVVYPGSGDGGAAPSYRGGVGSRGHSTVASSSGSGAERFPRLRDQGRALGGDGGREGGRAAHASIQRRGRRRSGGGGEPQATAEGGVSDGQGVTGQRVPHVGKRDILGVFNLDPMAYNAVTD
jgi:hypothetical protein